MRRSGATPSGTMAVVLRRVLCAALPIPAGARRRRFEGLIGCIADARAGFVDGAATPTEWFWSMCSMARGPVTLTQ